MLIRLQLRFVKKLSLKKIRNIFLVWIGRVISSIVKKPIIMGAPYSLSVEPVNYCNLKCPECIVGSGQLKRKRGMINIALYNKITDELSPFLVNLFLYFQGEPFLHPKIIEIIRIAQQKKIYTVISTNACQLNGHLATELIKSCLDKLIISLDGFSESSYESYRKGSNYKHVTTNIKNLISIRKTLKSRTPQIIIQVIVTRENEHEIGLVKEMKRSLGVDKIELKTLQVIDIKQKNYFLPKNKRYLRYKITSNGQYILKRKTKNRCARLWNSAVITWNGDVLPCCFDKNGQFVFGNLTNTTFAEIWKNEKYQIFRQKILKNRKLIAICNNCVG